MPGSEPYLVLETHIRGSCTCVFYYQRSKTSIVEGGRRLVGHEALSFFLYFFFLVLLRFMTFTYYTMCSERWTIGRLCLISRHVFEQILLLKESIVSDISHEN